MINLDIVILNAGVGYLYNLEDTPVEKYQEMFDTNVKGVFLWLKQVMPDMKLRNKGQIIVTSSTSAMKTWVQGGIYSATKHAVQAMILTLRKELLGTNVKVATVNPGAVNTSWFDNKGFKGDQFNRSEMLSAEDVVESLYFIINQSRRSNIESIVQMY